MLTRWPDLLRSAGDRVARSEWFVLAPIVYAIQLAFELVYRTQYALTHLYRVDFLAFYTGAKLLVTNPSQLYSTAAQFQIESAIAPALYRPLRFVNPPPVAFALIPLVNLPFTAALAWFFAVSGIALAVSAVLLERLLPQSMAWYLRWLLTISAIGYAGIENFGVGQWDSLQLLAILLAAIAFRKGRPLLAGVLLAVILIKPQLGLFILPALLLGRHWKSALGFLCGGVFWLFSSLLLVGTSGIRNWISILSLDHTTEGGASDSLPSFVQYCCGDIAGFATTALLIALGLSISYRVRARLTDWNIAVGLALALSFAVAAVGHRWDTELLAFPVVLIINRNPGLGLIAVLALALGALIPHVAGVLVALAIGAVVCAWLSSEPKSSLA